MGFLRCGLVAAVATLVASALASPTGELASRQEGTGVGFTYSFPEYREVFQVAPPVLGPEGPLDSWGRDRVKVQEPIQKRQETGACKMLLMEHTFASSYEKPFIGNYTPPDCEFNRVLLNFTATVQPGVQYDRLAIMYLGDTEIWRTSTAEPLRERGGAIWTYWKDVTPFMYFWKQPQKIIFDLGNIVDEQYTSPFNTTLTATFFVADEDSVGTTVAAGAEKWGPADRIIPVSARKSATDQVSAWRFPEDEAKDTLTAFPATRAAPCLAKVDSFDPGTVSGLDAWREVQVFIDDHLVGVSWPYPVLFTGAMSPMMHRPIVGLNTFDLKEQEIDITPWLPLLCDGEDHTVSLRVVCLDDTAAGGPAIVPTPSNWVLTGKVFVWLDEDEAKVQFDPSGGDIQSNPFVSETSMIYSLLAHRGFVVEGKIVTQAGEKEVSWAQSLNFTTNLEFSTSLNPRGGQLEQTTVMAIEGAESASGMAEYRSEYSYPFKGMAALRTWQGRDAERPWQGVYVVLPNYLFVQVVDQKIEGSPVFPSGVEAYNGTYGASHLFTTRESFHNEMLTERGSISHILYGSNVGLLWGKFRAGRAFVQ
ncbi:unnamed protein product [Parascedosporium putredinis]|uniref:Peptide N-acetyl-beta-D-glucosaminyl asparaginase amidase A N-terminal domain-containing protein n=1 Tax=Parascedosporium putredinis TaxID=1442378 RepID=A0A9P1M6K8_9PEZI|nr:unnamed protein product [Parascedosporium putredinis]CAI7989925.1 unnamed protein product [Parascedosporium putredinis]